MPEFTRGAPIPPFTAPDTPLSAGRAGGASAPLGAADPRTIGRYRLIGRLGQGGMGTVYLAEQVLPRRTVAIKMIRAELASPDVVRRFARETEVLGRLQHPGIAQIYEAGTEESPSGPVPWFAMELVHGPPLIAYADEHAGTTRTRLELFAKVCDAVDYAHQRGIIHRDLKPSNILVDTSGQPKILDFGIARATDADIQTTRQTSAGEIIGTLQYMSPEQVSGDPLDLDTRSDVYALGVTLYELLSGRLPYDIDSRPIHDAMRVIIVDDPPSLGSIDRRLRGDVETIVGRSLEKDKTRRYGSARELATDIRRYLNDEPILARPPSRRYQLRKFASRNRALVGGVITAVMLLTIGSVVSTSLAIRARTAERLAQLRQTDAEHEATRARAVSGFLQDMLSSADPSVAQGRPLTVREVLDQAARRVNDQALVRAPTVRAGVEATIGDVYSSLGAYGEAQTHLDTAYAVLVRAVGARDSTVASVLRRQGLNLYGEGDLKGARDADTRALALDLRQRPNDAETIRAEEQLALMAYTAGSLDSGEKLYRDALARARRGRPQSEAVVANSLVVLGNFLTFTERPAPAESLFQQAAEIYGRVEGQYNPDMIEALRGQAYALYRAYRDTLAEPIARRVVRLTEHVFGDDHPNTANALERLGQILFAEHDVTAAEPLLRRSLAIRVRRLGPQHPDVQLVRTTLARLLMTEHRYDEAQRLLELALTARRAAFGPTNPATGMTISDLGDLNRARGRIGSAEADYRSALAIFSRSQDSFVTDELLGKLAGIEAGEGRLDAAWATYAARLHEQRAAGPGDTSAAVAATLGHLADIAARQGRTHVADSLRALAAGRR